MPTMGKAGERSEAEPAAAGLGAGVVERGALFFGVFFTLVALVDNLSAHAGPRWQCTPVNQQPGVAQRYADRVVDGLARRAVKPPPVRYPRICIKGELP